MYYTSFCLKNIKLVTKSDQARAKEYSFLYPHVTVDSAVIINMIHINY